MKKLFILLTLLGSMTANAFTCKAYKHGQEASLGDLKSTDGLVYTFSKDGVDFEVIDVSLGLALSIRDEKNNVSISSNAGYPNGDVLVGLNLRYISEGGYMLDCI